MSAVVFDHRAHPGLICNTDRDVRAKLERFAQVGRDRIYFLFDFDRTLTTSKHTGDNPTTWQIMHDLLSAEGRKTSTVIRDKYLTLELAGQMSAEDSRIFSSSVLDLHTLHGTNWRDIEKVAKQVKLREGSQELFAACEAAHIPTVILSAGIRNIIELITRRHGIHPTMLLSIRLQFAPDGRVIGWDKDSLILTHTKRESVEQWLTHIRSVRPYTVLIGDTIEDARMIEGDDTVLRIRVCDVKNGDCVSGSTYLQESFAAGYDIVVEEDLSPIVRLTEWLSAASAAA
jgi:HAD superfamily phosphoserine phosphatase-like hydrolase